MKIFEIFQLITIEMKEFIQHPDKENIKIYEHISQKEGINQNLKKIQIEIYPSVNTIGIAIFSIKALYLNEMPLQEIFSKLEKINKNLSFGCVRHSSRKKFYFRASIRMNFVSLDNFSLIFQHNLQKSLLYYEKILLALSIYQREGSPFDSVLTRVFKEENYFKSFLQLKITKEIQAPITDENSNSDEESEEYMDDDESDDIKEEIIMLDKNKIEEFRLNSEI